MQGTPERGRYGRRHPRPGLTTGAVIDAGRRIIERGGLDALSMRAVAAELGTAATSLYRHVADRDTLLLEILEQVARGLPVDVPGRTPKTRLHRRLVRAHDYMAEHVWVLHTLIHGELVTETALAFADACLADFLAAGLSPRRAMSAFTACWHLTIGELLDSHPPPQPHGPTQRHQALSDIDPVQLPHLAHVTAQLSPPNQRPDEFPKIMDVLLSGLLADSLR